MNVSTIMGNVFSSQYTLDCFCPRRLSIDENSDCEQDPMNMDFVCKPDPDHKTLFIFANRVFNEYMYKNGSEKYPQRTIYCEMNDVSSELGYLAYKVATIVLQRNGIILLEYEPNVYDKTEIYINQSIYRVDFCKYCSHDNKNIMLQTDDKCRLLCTSSTDYNVYTVILCLGHRDFGGNFEVIINDMVQYTHMFPNTIIHIAGGIPYRINYIPGDDKVLEMIVFRYKRSPYTNKNTMIANKSVPYQTIDYPITSVLDFVCAPHSCRESLLALAKHVFAEYMQQEDSKDHMYDTTDVDRRKIFAGEDLSNNLQQLINLVVDDSIIKNGIAICDVCPTDMGTNPVIRSDIYRIDFHHHRPNNDKHECSHVPWHIDDQNGLIVCSVKKYKLLRTQRRVTTEFSTKLV